MLDNASVFGQIKAFLLCVLAPAGILIGWAAKTRVGPNEVLCAGEIVPAEVDALIKATKFVVQAIVHFIA